MTIIVDNEYSKGHRDALNWVHEEINKMMLGDNGFAEHHLARIQALGDLKAELGMIDDMPRLIGPKP